MSLLDFDAHCENLNLAAFGPPSGSTDAYAISAERARTACDLHHFT